MSEVAPVPSGDAPASVDHDRPEVVGYTTVEELVRARLSESVGGLRGSIEAAIPTVAFVLAWLIGHQARPAIGVAVGAVVLLSVGRLLQHQTMRFVLSSIFGVAIAAVLVLRSGKAQDAFLPGIIYSAVAGSLTLLSVLVRWPLIGFVVGAAEDPEDPFAWHRDRGVVRLCQRLTVVLVGLYAVRLAIMGPLYLADQVTWLGVAKIALGWPLYALAIAAMGALLLKGHTPLEDVPPSNEESSDD